MSLFFRSFLLFCLLLSFTAKAENTGFGGGDTGVPGIPRSKKSVEDRWQEKQSMDSDSFGIMNKGVLARVFSTNTPRIKTPGFISITRVPKSGTVVGGVREEVRTYHLNSNLYIRWEGARPSVGDIFSVYTPRIILQSRSNPTDFELILEGSPKLSEKLGIFRHAGFFYEINGEVEVMEDRGSVVRARVIGLNKTIAIGDALIRPLPTLNNVPRSYSPKRITASVVFGHPHDRISPAAGSFMYINRGTRDGVGVGTVFRTLEEVKLRNMPSIQKKVNLGEAVVIYVTTSYATALITKQWKTIRLGSLLETSSYGAGSYEKEKSATAIIRSRSRSSQLDIIEKELDIEGLTPEEKARLEALHQQEIRTKDGVEPDSLIIGPDEAEEEEKENIATQYFAPKKKKKKKKKKQEVEDYSDEESLNSLF